MTPESSTETWTPPGGSPGAIAASESNTTPSKLPSFFTGMFLVAELELRQRVRSTRWIVALTLWMLALALVTWGLWALYRLTGSGTAAPDLFGAVALFTLGATLVLTPALSATTINGDRHDATLAILQATPLSGAQLAWGKWLAGLTAGLAFIAGALPFLIGSALVSEQTMRVVVITVAVLIFEAAVVCALGLGFSALTNRPAGSTALTFLLVAFLTIGLPLSFLLLLPAVTTHQSGERYQQDWSAQTEPPSPDWQPTELPCIKTTGETTFVHTEKTWWLLAGSPVVILSDATTVKPRQGENVKSVMGGISWATAAARHGAAGDEARWEKAHQNLRPGALSPDDTCQPRPDGRSVEVQPVQTYGNPQVWDLPVNHAWYWGAALHLLLALGGLALAVRRLGTPARRLPTGVRIA